VTNSTTGSGTVKLLSVTKCSYRLTVTVTDIVTSSTTGIGTVKLLSGTKCSYRLTVAITDIVTNSTTGICKVKLLSVTKYNIISTGLKACGGVEVWLPSLNYKPAAGEWLIARPTPAIVSSKHKPVPDE